MRIMEEPLERPVSLFLWERERDAQGEGVTVTRNWP
jgi:hypothetical protein